ncbi:MAG: insulinase family protein, partial [Alphaproteobacteria bacterium]
PERPRSKSPLSADEIIETRNEKTSAAIFVGTDGLDLSSPERAVLDVLDAALSGIGYPGGRLQEALRGRADLVYVVHAFPFYGLDRGYFGVISQTTRDNLERVQQVILKELARLREQPLTPEELQTAKDMVITMHQLSAESLDTRAERAAVNEVLGLGWDFDRTYLEQVKAVSAEDVLRVARRLFQHTLLVRTLPQQGETAQNTAAAGSQ